MAKPAILLISDVVVHKVLGGAERVLQEEALGLQKRGYAVSVLHRSNKNTQGYFRGVRVRGVALKPLWSCFLRFRQALQALEKENRVALLMGYQPFSSFLAFLQCRQKPKIYLYLSSWVREIQTRRHVSSVEIAFARWMEKKVLDWADELLAISAYAKQELGTLYPQARKNNIGVNWLGVDSKRFSPVHNKRGKRQEVGLPENLFLYLTVRNLVPRMGLVNLITAFSLLPKEVRADAHLCIAGDGPLRRDLQETIKEKGLTREVEVRHLCDGTPSYLPEQLIPLADAFVLPTQTLENFGLVIPEALACEVPVIGTPVGAIPEVLGAWDNHFLMRGSQPEQIAEKMLFLYQNRSTLSQWGKTGRAFVQKHCTWEEHLQRLDKVLQHWL